MGSGASYRVFHSSVPSGLSTRMAQPPGLAETVLLLCEVLVTVALIVFDPLDTDTVSV